MTQGIPIIRLENLSKRFITDNGAVDALKNICLSIDKGSIIGIIGKSGAGKSTLVRCINFLEQPDSGEIYINGNAVSELSQKELNALRRSVGMIFQHFNLFMQRNALSNVMYPLEIMGVPKQKCKTRALEMLEQVGLADKAGAYPSQLSGGQKQRVAIARALATEPDILLCDEATSALDPETTRSVLALIRDLGMRLGLTVVIITHEMSVLEEICTHFALMENSVIVETGRVSELFSSPKTDEAKALIFPDNKSFSTSFGKRCCRIVFDGKSSFEPVIANLALESRLAVNIMYADTKNINGTAYGQMILQLPEKQESGDRVISILKSKGLAVEEINHDF